jgi:hypothetical protein
LRIACDLYQTEQAGKRPEADDHLNQIESVVALKVNAELNNGE